MYSSCGSLAVKVTDSWQERHVFEPSATKDPPCRGDRCMLNLLRLKRFPVGVVCELGEEDSASSEKCVPPAMNGIGSVELGKRQPIGVNVHCTQHPIREQPLSSQSCQKTENFPPRRSTIAMPPGFHRPTNRRHATQQKGKHHSRHASHQRLVMIWD
ncbi:hypothetical protein TNCV_2284051 [Trichonephila clavipes]|nr:hypothetical protein TNCV_2284051 [Trichonephila clavipes]